MQVSLETTEGLERKMTVEVPAEKITSVTEERLQGMCKQAKISGFRPGKVPIRVIRQRFGKQVFNEVVTSTMQSSYQEAVMQEKLRPAGNPQIEPVNLKVDEDLKYIATFEVYPEIEVADVSGFEIETAEVEIKDADIDDMIEKLRKQKTEWEDADRAAKQEDRVTMDFKGSVDGEFFEGGSQDDFATVIGSNNLLPDFEKQLEGVKAGDEKTFDVTFPEDYGQKDLANKVAKFEIVVKKVEQAILPEVNEEFVKGFGIDDGKLDTLKEQMTQNMQVELEQRKKAFKKDQVMQKLFEANEFEIPKALITQEIQALRQQSMQSMNLQDESMLPDTLFEEEAKRRILIGLTVGEIAQKQDIKVDQEKVNQALNVIATNYGQPEEVIQYYRSNQKAMANLEVMVVEEQVVDWVVEQSKTVSKPFTFDEFVNKQA